MCGIGYTYRYKQKNDEGRMRYGKQIRTGVYRFEKQEEVMRKTFLIIFRQQMNVMRKQELK